MDELKSCPFCGGKIEERGGQCNYGKKTMTLDLKCKHARRFSNSKASGMRIHIKRRLRHLTGVQT